MGRNIEAKAKRQKSESSETPKTPAPAETHQETPGRLVSEWFVLTELQRQVDSLLTYAIHPQTETLTADWMNAVKNRIRDYTSDALQSFSADSARISLIWKAQSASLAFVTLMHDRPKLSTMRREEWTVPAYCRIFDELDSVSATLKTHADELEQEKTDFSPAEDSPAVVTEKSVTVDKTCDAQVHVRSGGAQQAKIVVPTNEDVARVVNLVADGMPVQTAAKKIAENSEHTFGSLKSMFYTWKRSTHK
jgi:hypothetical protein